MLTVCFVAKSEFETMLAMPAHKLLVGSIGLAGRHEDATARIHHGADAVRVVCLTRYDDPHIVIQTDQTSVWMTICAVPESAMPLLTMSGPFASTGRICAASTSARPPPFMSFKPVTAQRSS